jgi:hypothetical protein
MSFELITINFILVDPLFINSYPFNLIVFFIEINFFPKNLFENFKILYYFRYTYLSLLKIVYLKRHHQSTQINSLNFGINGFTSNNVKVLIEQALN